ncbi:MAG: hypothetical protein U9N86_16710 [Bacteroidota bacterium]|nr:hypothetical protein [Bacteroidota bacterium]
MNQERAILHFNKFKSLKNEYVRDMLTGLNYKIAKVKLIKISESDYKVKILVESDLEKHTKEIDSVYANNNFKEIIL